MRNGLRIIGVTAAAVLALTAMAVYDGVVIKRVGKVGDVVKLRMKIEMDAGGQAEVFSVLMTDKITKVSDSGDLTFETKTSEVKVNLGGEEQDAGGQGPPPKRTTMTSSGEVLSVASDQTDDDMVRRANLLSLRFPATALKVGDSWKVDIKKNDKGSVDAMGFYKVEAQETVGAYDTYRIHGSTRESGGDTPASMEGTFWVCIKDGSLVKAEGILTNAPMPQIGPMDMKVSLVRE